MSNINALLFHKGNFFIRRMNTMSHDRRTVTAEKIKLAICFSIKMCIRAKLPHPGNFTEILRKVRLHRQVILFLNLRKLLHQCIRTGRSKSRSKDRLYIFKFIKRILNPLNRSISRSLSTLFLQLRRTITVHIYLADHSLYSGFIQLFHQDLGSRDMQSSENTCSCIRALLHILSENRISLFCKLCIFITCFLRKSISIQPVQQLKIHTRGTKRILRSMKMQISQSRNDQLIAKICT